VAEGGWAVVLDEEVREPGERVGYDKCRKDEPGAAEQDCGEYQRPTRESPDRVKHARQGLAMREHVERPKIREAARVLHTGDSSAELETRNQKSIRTVLRPTAGVRRTDSKHIQLRFFAPLGMTDDRCGE